MKRGPVFYTPTVPRVEPTVPHAKRDSLRLSRGDKKEG